MRKYPKDGEMLFRHFWMKIKGYYYGSIFNIYYSITYGVVALYICIDGYVS